MEKVFIYSRIDLLLKKLVFEFFFHLYRPKLRTVQILFYVLLVLPSCFLTSTFPLLSTIVGLFTPRLFFSPAFFMFQINYVKYILRVIVVLSSSSFVCFMYPLWISRSHILSNIFLFNLRDSIELYVENLPRSVIIAVSKPYMITSFYYSVIVPWFEVMVLLDIFIFGGEVQFL